MSLNCPDCTESWAADECLPCWPMPDFKCPCLDLSNTDHAELWAESWRVASSYVFNMTGQRWPGKCMTETVRPCVPRKCPSSCSCYSCGVYNYLEISDAFCWPICEILEVDIAPTSCSPDGVTWTEGAGIRLERVMGVERLVLERDADTYCCPTFPRQDLCAPLGDDNTWSITARTGCNPPPEILRGTAAFACDIAQGCIDTKCGLPRNVSTASFSGVTVNYDQGEGKSIDLQMLKKLMSEYTRDDIKESFLNPCRSVTFHHVDGPRHVEEYDPPAPCIPDAEEIAEIAAVPKNDLGVYKAAAVSPIN